MADQFTTIPVAGLVTHNSAAPIALSQLGVLPALANAADPTFTEGNQTLQSVNLSGYTRVTVGTAIVKVSSTTAANTAANPIFVQTSNGTTANAVTAPEFVELSDGTNPLGTFANPLITAGPEASANVKDSGQFTTVNLATNTSTTFTTSALTANKQGTLMKVHASASVRLKVVIQTVSAGVSPTTATVRTYFTEAFQSVQDQEVFGAVVVAAAATNMGKFQLVITNEDNKNAADVYAAITWGEN